MIYYAHPTTWYSTPDESADVERIVSLLGARVLNPNTPEHAAGYAARGMDYFFEEVLPLCSLDPIQTEGCVVVDGAFNRVKIKSSRYVALHHMKGEATLRRAIELWQTGETDEALAHFPEFAPKIIPVQQVLSEAAMRAHADIIAGRSIESRKEYAALVKERPWSAACFRHFDDRHNTKVSDVEKTLRSQSLASLERLVEAIGIEP